MVLKYLEFEEVDAVSSSAGPANCFAHQQPFAAPSATFCKAEQPLCWEILDGDQYMSQDALARHAFDDGDASETLFSSASAFCRPSASVPPPPANAMEELLAAEAAGCGHRPCHGYLFPRQDIKAGDRASVVDNMTRAATQLGLSSDVLFLGVSLLDRTLAALHLQPALLDTAALACLWVAAKYEHCVIPPAVHFLAAAQTDFTSAHSRQLLVDMEARVLQAVDYRICAAPTTKTFLRAAFQALQQQLARTPRKQQPAPGAAPDGQIDPRLYFCASYLAEMSLLEYKLVPFPPSQVAAAAFASASLLVGGALHDMQLVSLTGYSLKDIKLPMQWLLSVHHTLYQGRHLPLTSMYETARKFRHASVCRVALVPSISSTSDPRLRLCQ